MQGEGRTDAEGSKVSVTAVSWSTAGKLELAEWVRLGRRLGVMSRGSQWWVGDWLRYGQEQYSRRYVNAARITGYDPQTLMNFVYVASRIEISRRREILSWSHHAEVAALPQEAQDRWLEEAEREVLSVRALRSALREAANAAAGPSSSDPEDQGSKTVCPKCGHRFVPQPGRDSPAAVPGREVTDPPPVAPIRAAKGAVGQEPDLAVAAAY